MTNPVVTSIEPPGLALADFDDEADVMEVLVTLREADETTRTASVTLAASAGDGDIVDAFVACLHGCATMRGPSLSAAVQRWVPVR
ncbi:MAG: hypothetical protein ACRDTZ_01260 [Pseudonocardiaceae bacterium]